MKNKKRRRVIITLTIVLFVLAITACFFAWPEYREYIRDVQYKTAPIGSTVKFGQYEQDGNLKNGPEEIEWFILDREDDKILLISKYALMHSTYMDISYTDICNQATDLLSWKDSNPRRILNEEFYHQAFSEKEQQKILLTMIEPDIYSTEYPSDIATYDHIFILSAKEAEHYFSTDTKRMCDMTKFAFQTTGAKAKWSVWWLRSYAEHPMCLVVIEGDGSIWGKGYDCTCGMDIRPALWLYID